MKKSYIAANILFIVAVMAADGFYAYSHLFAVKITASVLFTAECVFNVIICAKKGTKMKFPLIMLAAITVACAADVLLNIVFLIGMVLFAFGHILYYISYCVREKILPQNYISAGISSALLIAMVLFDPELKFGGDKIMQVASCIYAVIISVMVGKAFSDALRKRTPLNILIAVGSGLFWVSDFALMFSTFGNAPFAGAICLFSYYPAQIILAMSPLFYAIEHEKTK